MTGKKPAEHQMSIFDVALGSFIDMNHELVLLSKQIDWEEVESEFAEYYCADNGRPSVPTSGSPNQSYYQRRKARKKFCKRATWGIG